MTTKPVTDAASSPSTIVLTITRDELLRALDGGADAGGTVVRAARAFIAAVDQPEYVARPGGGGFERTGARHAGAEGAKSLLANFGDAKYRNLAFSAAAVRAQAESGPAGKRDHGIFQEAVEVGNARRFEKLVTAEAAKGKAMSLVATKAEVDGAAAGAAHDSPVGRALATFGGAVRQKVWKDGRPTSETKDGKEGLGLVSEGFGKARHRRVELSVAAVQEIHVALGAKDPALAVSAMVELGEAGQDSERRGEAIARARQAAAAGKGR